MNYGKLKNRPFSIIIVTGDFMKTIFKNCTLLDGTKDMAARENIDVAIENGKIVEIGSITPSVSDEVIDLSGKYLMPGLINLHGSSSCRRQAAKQADENHSFNQNCAFLSHFKRACA